VQSLNVTDRFGNTELKDEHTKWELPGDGAAHVANFHTAPAVSFK
jgi:hypothetical protein